MSLTDLPLPLQLLSMPISWQWTNSLSPRRLRVLPFSH